MGAPEGTDGGPGLTDTQDYLTSPDIGPLTKYRQMAVGSDRGWGHLMLYEALTGCLGPVPGAAGYFLRQKLYGLILGELGRGAAIGRNVTIRHPRRVSLGRNVVIDENVLVDARDGRISLGDRTIVSRNAIVSTRGGTIRIGSNVNIGTGSRLATLVDLVVEDYVLIAHNCYIGGGNHRHDRIDVPIISQGMEDQKGVAIGRGAWLGAGSMVMDGVTIGHDAIIGAAALVNEDIPPLAVAVGQPARVIRFRDGR